jgi:hypothetical protein
MTTRRRSLLWRATNVASSSSVPTCGRGRSSAWRARRVRAPWPSLIHQYLWRMSAPAVRSTASVVGRAAFLDATKCDSSTETVASRNRQPPHRGDGEGQDHRAGHAGVRGACCRPERRRSAHRRGRLPGRALMGHFGSQRVGAARSHRRTVHLAHRRWRTAAACRGRFRPRAVDGDAAPSRGEVEPVDARFLISTRSPGRSALSQRAHAAGGTRRARRTSHVHARSTRRVEVRPAPRR